MNLHKILTILVFAFTMGTQLLGATGDLTWTERIGFITNQFVMQPSCDPQRPDEILFTHSREFSPSTIGQSFDIGPNEEFEVSVTITACYRDISVNLIETIPDSFELISLNSFDSQTGSSVRLAVNLAAGTSNEFTYSLKAGENAESVSVTGNATANQLFYEVKPAQSLSSASSIAVIPRLIDDRDVLVVPFQPVLVAKITETIPFDPESTSVRRLDAKASSTSPDCDNSYEWSIDGEIVSNMETFEYNFPGNGTYRVELLLTNDCQETANTYGEVRIYEFPDEGRIPDPEEPLPPPPDPLIAKIDIFSTDQKKARDIYFSAANSSTDADCTIESYKWNLGNNIPRSTVDFDYAYPNPGIYVVALEIADNCNRTDRAQKVIRIRDNIRPIAKIHTSHVFVEPGTRVEFDGSASEDPEEGGAVISWQWEFSDGSRAEGPTASHTFDISGAHSVRLIVTDNDNEQSVPEEIVIRVNKQISIPCITGKPNPACIAIPIGLGIARHLLAPPKPPPGFAPQISPVDIVPSPTLSGAFVFFPHDQLLVKFDRGISKPDAQRIIQRSIGPAPGVQIIGYFPVIETYLVKFPWISGRNSIDSRLRELERLERRLNRRLPGRVWIMKNYLAKTALTETSDIEETCKIVDQESCNTLNGAFDITGVIKAWELIRQQQVKFDENVDLNRNAIKISAIDGGVLGTHPDLLGILDLKDSYSYVARGDGNVVSRWDRERGFGHGTSVVGPFGAINGEGNNEYNGIISGVTDRYSVVVFKTYPYQGERIIDHVDDVRRWLAKIDAEQGGDTNLDEQMENLLDAASVAAAPLSSVLDAIRRSAEAGAEIVNLSMEWDYGSVLDYEEQNEIEIIYDIFQQYFSAYENDILFISAAGNGRPPTDDKHSLSNRIGIELQASEKVNAPGGVIAPNNLTVAATDEAGTALASFSNFGSAVDISAPGVDIYSLDINSEYGIKDGTSFATPILSGIAGLVWTLHRAMDLSPDITPVQLKSLLIKSSIQINSNIKLANACIAVYRKLNNLDSERPTEVELEACSVTQDTTN